MKKWCVCVGRGGWGVGGADRERETIDQHHGLFPVPPKNTHTSFWVMHIRGC